LAEGAGDSYAIVETRYGSRAPWFVGVSLLLAPVSVFAGVVFGYESIRYASFICPSIHVAFDEGSKTGYPGSCFLREAAPGLLLVTGAFLLVLCAMTVASMSDPRRGFRLGVACVGGVVTSVSVWFVVAGNLDRAAAIIGSVMWLFVIGVMSGWSGWKRRERVELPAAAVLATSWCSGRSA
jgi:hypothetical protein